MSPYKAAGLTSQVVPEAGNVYAYLSRNSSMDTLLAYDGSDDVGFETLTKMYGDSDIERFVFMKAALSASMVQGYTNENKEIEEFVWKTLKDAEGSFHLTLADALADCTVYGHHFSEIVWKKLAAGKYSIKRFVYIDPVDRTVILNGSHDIKAVRHFNGDIKRNKLLYLNFRPNRGIWGKSEIASLYPYFLLQRTSLYNFGKTLERFGFPWAIGKANDTEGMLSTLVNMYNIASAAIGTDEEINLLEPQSKGEVFDYALDIALRAYLRKLGIPELLVNVKNSGTYNLGEVQFNWFLDENENNTKQKNDELVASFVKPIVDLNFGEQDSYGEFKILKNPNAETMKQYAAVMQMIAQGNSLNDPIRKQIFGMMGFDQEEIGNTFEKVLVKGDEGNGQDSKSDSKNSGDN